MILPKKSFWKIYEKILDGRNPTNSLRREHLSKDAPICLIFKLIDKIIRIKIRKNTSLLLHRKSKTRNFDCTPDGSKTAGSLREKQLQRDAKKLAISTYQSRSFAKNLSNGTPMPHHTLCVLRDFEGALEHCNEMGTF